MSLTHLVSYADTDAGGVLHHARYIELAERGYHHWLKRRQLSFRKLGRDHDITLVVVDLVARYRAAVRFEDEIRIVTRLHAIDRGGLEWRTRFINNDALSFTLTTKMACIDSMTRTIVTVPEFLVAKLGDEIEDALDPITGAIDA